VGGVLEQGAALAESREVASFVVGDAVEPAAVQDTDPFEGECTEGALVSGAAGAAGIVEGFGPEGAGDGLGGPLDEAGELGASPVASGRRLLDRALSDDPKGRAVFVGSDNH
jgi:hypothetical protein